MAECVNCDAQLIDKRCPNPDCECYSIEGYIKSLKGYKKKVQTIRGIVCGMLIKADRCVGYVFEREMRRELRHLKNYLKIGR